MMTIRYSDFYSIQRRYKRSILLKSDWENFEGLDGYIPTPNSKRIIEQIIDGVISKDLPSAWTITGPFGSGKSTFALFLLDILAREKKYLKESEALLAQKKYNKKPFLPIILQGRRFPIKEDIINSIINTFETISQNFQFNLNLSHLKDIKERDVINTIKFCATESKKLGFEGLLILIDEFGKYLEFASDNPANTDLMILQDLAELAERNEIPIIVITILHTAFSEYLSEINDQRKSEWQKVQGRFTDVSFIESSEQFIKMIGSAIKAESKNDITKEVSNKINKILDNPVYLEILNKFQDRNALVDCGPLHPSLALLLWPIFRSEFSQNERSLFSFLNDYSIYGFQEFLQREQNNVILYNVFDIYDYITFSIGDSIFSSFRARQWSEITVAIDRVDSNAPDHAIDIIKTIGLINLFGKSVRLKASNELIFTIFQDDEKVKIALRYLLEKSIIFFRKFEGAYSVWEGSDIDLEEEYEHAKLTSKESNYVEKIKTLIDISPIIARAHYIKSGTMRYFDIAMISGSEEEIVNAINEKNLNSDGIIYFVLSRNISSRDKLIDFVKEISSKVDKDLNRIIFAFPEPMRGLQDAINTLDNWTHVENNTPELVKDRVARQEVKARIRKAKEKLIDIAGETFGAPGYVFKPSNSIWVYRSKSIKFNSSVKFQKWLSSICDSLFSSSPNIFNELINRHQISTSAAHIRKNLIEKMINNDGEENLGILGTPPEYSMYRTLLDEGGLYKKRLNGKPGFKGLPKQEWRPIWYEIRSFLESTQECKRSILDLFRILIAPPYGLKRGVIPIIICSVILAYKDEIALYEDGVYIPEIQPDHIELMIKAPNNFEIRLFKSDINSISILENISKILYDLNLISNDINKNLLLATIKPLVIFVAKLPEYSRNTKKLNPKYILEFRESLITAKDPHDLVFHTIPNIFNVSINTEDGRKKYIEYLEESIVTLKQTYPKLLDRIEDNFRDLFKSGMFLTSKEFRDNLINRAIKLKGFSPDQKIKLFIQESERMEKRDWREVFARVINDGQPPRTWLDHSVIDFQQKLTFFYNEFIRLEELVLEKGNLGEDNFLIRVSILNEKMHEKSSILSITEEDKDILEPIIERIENNINSSGDSSDIILKALSILIERYIKLEKNGG